MGDVQPHPANLAELARLVNDAAEELSLFWGRMADDVPHRLSLPQLRTLLVVKRAGRVNLTALAEEMDASLSSTSRLCDRLMAAGLLRRSANDHDRRGTLVHLSPEGASVLEQLAEVRIQALVEILARMAPQHRQALATGLRAYSDAARPPADSSGTAVSGA
jgi:DNA-binding MarR family transcriptional regulator